MKTSMSKQKLLNRLWAKFARAAIKKTNLLHAATHSSEKISSNSNNSLIEVFLYYPWEKQPEKNTVLNDFFIQELDKIISTSSHLPIFLDQSLALWYSRFMGESHAIIKAYVAEQAIQGHNQEELALQEGTLDKTSIHGFFPSDKKGETYLQNPLFNQILSNTEKTSI
ncbi:MAG: hypothetical protein AB7F64_02425 [Gammaproteobacteria bacterium]